MFLYITYMYIYIYIYIYDLEMYVVVQLYYTFQFNLLGQSVLCVKLSTEKDLCIPGSARNAQVELFAKEETWNFAP